MINFSVMPSIFFQQHGNSLALRHIVPKSASQTELSWTHYGFDDDDDTMDRRRLKQANLMGPAGYVAIDDSEVLAQMAVAEAGAGVGAARHDGRHRPGEDTMVTETLIRGFYAYYREKMGLA